MQNAMRKHENETKNCTFKPEILTKTRTPDLEAQRKKSVSAKGTSRSPDVISLPAGSKVEDRLHQRGL